MSYMSKFVAAIVGLLVMAIVFSRQLFLFTAFRDPQGLLDPQGGRYHLWLSLVAAVIACIAGALMFYFFARHGTNASPQTPNTARQPAIAVPGKYPAANSSAPASSDKGSWAQLNPWLSEGQANDRRPMDRSVADSYGPPSGQRTLARESHQLNFKKWSQSRRD